MEDAAPGRVRMSDTRVVSRPMTASPTDDTFSNAAEDASRNEDVLGHGFKMVLRVIRRVDGRD